MRVYDSSTEGTPHNPSDWISTVIEQAIVRKYDPEKRYGFVYVLDSDGRRTSDEAFFHVNDARHVESDGTSFSRKRTERIGGRNVTVMPPNEGDRLLIDLIEGERGLKARRWGYADGVTTGKGVRSR